MQVATGGVDSILKPTMEDKLDALHKAIASVVAEPKSEKSEEEHILENFHSSRTVRRLILDCPTFASTLWNTALKGKCEMWAPGHRLAYTIFLVPTFKTCSPEPSVKCINNYSTILLFLFCDCSGKVISAFLESSDSKVRELAKKELQPLIDRGILKIPEKQSAIEG